jgi:hypothetical protein
MLFTAWTAPSTLPDENELARFVDKKLSTSVLEFKVTTGEVAAVVELIADKVSIA